VFVKTDDITIKGSGADRTELVPPSTPHPLCGADQGSVNGICAADIDDQFNVISPVENLKVKDLSVHGFSGAGVFLFGNDGAVVTGVRAEDNEEYGIAQFNSTNGVYSWNLTARNGEAGVYVGDSPNANAEVEHNLTFDNRGFGIFLRDASNGEAEHNASWGNCIGILVLNTGSGAHGWEVKDNRVTENDLACPPSDEGGPISGIGIAVSSASDIEIEDNAVLDNRPGGPTDFSGGILLVSEAAQLADIEVAHNVAFRNDPFDILWDQSGTNVRFSDNRCDTSSPDGLCESGRRGDGDHGDHHGGGDDNHHNKNKHKHHKHRKD